MVESSKILTVSYGTFSCTLEGFDDSFGTMKAIAEYFRDLAADDRYFGAEPPTPDVHMMAKIAEREITRRVDASTEDGSIVLRAQERPAPAMPPQVEKPDPVQVAAAAVVPQPMAEPAQDISLKEEFETAHPVATAPVEEPVAGPEAEDIVSSPLVASGQVTSDLDTSDTPHQDEAEFADHPDAESVAAKLQRIRAVVGTSSVAADADYVEDQHAPDMPALDDVSFADEVVAPEDDAAQEVAEQSFENDDTFEDAEPADVDSDDAILGNLAAKMAASAETVDDAPADHVEPEGEKPLVRARVLRLRKTEVTEVAVEEEASLSADSFAFRDDEMDDDAYDFEDDVLDVATLDGLDDLDDPKISAQTTLSDEDEEDLMQELAEVERDFAPTDLVADEAEPEAADIPEAEAEAEPIKARNSLPETDDAMMSHILDQTDQELNEPEGSRRRNAIAQLKAAVAATEAARQLGDKAETAQEAEGAFRDDLNDVVRPAKAETVQPGKPTRVTKPATRTARPRPAPLKLVASQRIDNPAEAPADDAPVAPRRVAVTEEISAATADNFAEFAENMGATELPDLLEAAAAYTAFVEGSEDFSRPQIMKKVQLGASVDFSREDGLRSFGTLLRQGRISKVRGGRFQVSEETRFRPETIAS